VKIKSVAIGTAMDDALVHRFEQAAIGWLAVQLNDSANSAHSVLFRVLIPPSRLD
jgi:hypothetical protein